MEFAILRIYFWVKDIILVAVTAHLWKSAVDSSFSLLGWTTSYASLIIIVNSLNLIIILKNATFYSVPLQSIIRPPSSSSIQIWHRPGLQAKLKHIERKVKREQPHWVSFYVVYGSYKNIKVRSSLKQFIYWNESVKILEEGNLRKISDSPNINCFVNTDFSPGTKNHRNSRWISAL